MDYDDEVQLFIEENNIERLCKELEIISLIIILSTTPKRINNA